MSYSLTLRIKWAVVLYNCKYLTSHSLCAFHFVSFSWRSVYLVYICLFLTFHVCSKYSIVHLIIFIPLLILSIIYQQLTEIILSIRLVISWSTLHSIVSLIILTKTRRNVYKFSASVCKVNTFTYVSFHFHRFMSCPSQSVWNLAQQPSAIKSLWPINFVLICNAKMRVDSLQFLPLILLHLMCRKARRIPKWTIIIMRMFTCFWRINQHVTIL